MAVDGDRRLRCEQQQPSCAQPRNVYLDLGTNWGNTLRLHHDLMRWVNQSDKLNEPWLVYGFEASPLIAPFVDQFVRWLNHEVTDPPRNCLPPSGSSAHLSKFASAFGCDQRPGADHLRCLRHVLDGPLAALRPDVSLNSSRLVRCRLAEAATWCPQRRCTSASSRSSCSRYASKYVFVPAAVGGRAGWTAMQEDPWQLLRGGALPVWSPNRVSRDTLQIRHVRTVDFAQWIKATFAPSDYVVVKMDIETAEYAVLAQLDRVGALGLLDVLSFETHPGVAAKHVRADLGGGHTPLPDFVHALLRGEDAKRVLEAKMPWARITREADGVHDGFDALSRPQVTRRVVAEEARRCAALHRPAVNASVAARAAKLQGWLETRGRSALSRGYCETASQPGDCSHGDKGSWALHGDEISSLMGAARACVKRCAECARCQTLSFSPTWRDCSWFARCDLSALHAKPSDFWTIELPGVPEDAMASHF